MPTKRSAFYFKKIKYALDTIFPYTCYAIFMYNKYFINLVDANIQK